MTTLVSVPNVQVRYDLNPASPNFGFTRRNIPQVRPGGDSILFLRSNRTDPKEPFRDFDPAAPSDPLRAIYVQGTVDQTLPIIGDIWDVDSSQGGRDAPIHTLLGVSSVQRTVRYDRWYDTRAGRFTEGKAIWYLIADEGGVFEVRFDPTIQAPASGEIDP